MNQQATSSATNANPAGSLSSADLERVAVAGERLRQVARAAKLASFNFWCFAASSAFSLALALFYPSGLLAAGCLALLALNERKGGRLLSGLETKGGLLLFYNQLGFLTLVVLYCSWRILDCYFASTSFATSTQSDSVMSELLADGDAAAATLDLESIRDLYKTAVIVCYVTIMAVSAIFQVLCAWIYYRAHKVLIDFIQQTPDWIIAVLKAAS